MNLRLVAALVLAVAPFAVSRAAGAADPPPAAQPTPIAVPTLPPTDPTTQAIIRAAAGLVNDALARERATAANTTHGTVTYFHRYDLQVQTGANAYRSVRLHPGTVINPRGATPGSGTVVDVSGVGQPDGTLDASTITVLR